MNNKENFRILHVEDYPNIAYPVMAALKIAGYGRITCLTCEEDVNSFFKAHNGADLVILDSSSPRTSKGRFSVTSLRSLGYEGPVIVHSDEEKIRYQKNQENVRIVSKQSSLSELVKNVDSLLGIIR